MNEIRAGEDLPEAEEIADWLRREFAREMKLPETAIDPTRPMAYYGLDSMAAITLVAGLESFLGRPVEETVLWDHPTIEALSQHLAGETARAATGTDGER